MSILKINDSESSAFARGDKKQAWTAVRRRLGIGGRIKLGVNNVRGAADYRMLYVKGSAPRQYLIDAYGRTTTDVNYGAARDAATPVPSRFAAAADTSSSTGWFALDRDTLLEVVRDHIDDDDEVSLLPADFPATLAGDALVLDPATGTLYFRR